MKPIKLAILITALGAVGCSSFQPLPEKALIAPATVTEAIELEQTLDNRKGVAIPQGASWFEVVEGTVPVIVTAPHATRPFRNGKYRFSDGGGTAALAVAIGELTGATVMYTTYEGPSDPNYYDNNAFKGQLKQLIEKTKPKLVLDLHGSHPYRSYDIDIGTMNGASLLGEDALLDTLLARLRSEGIDSLSYNRFPAAKHQTITKFSSLQGVPAIQLEMNATWVNPGSGNVEAQRFSKLLQALVRFIDESVKGE